MLVGIFKSNQKIINILIIVLVMILWAPSFWAKELINSDYNSLFYILKDINNIKWLRFLVVVFLICVQGMYLNFIVN